MERSIDDILSEQPAAETPAPEAPTDAAPAEPIVDAPSGILRDEKGRFAPKETGVEQPAPQPEAAAEPVPPTETSNQLPPAEYAALKDERRKRQEAESRAAAIEAHYANLARQQQQAPQQPPVDFWDDPHGYMSAQFNQFGQSLLQQWEQRQQVQRIDASEQVARGKYADYDEAYVAFEQAVQANPRLAYELAQSSDPGEFAYAKGKAALAIQTVGSLDALKAQIRSELEAELKAAVPAVRPTLPSTTAADGSVGSRSGPEWSGPKPLGAILKG